MKWLHVTFLGYGGGYNDRGIVEYKSREESDSEYDEFGRLKKRRKHSSGHQTKRDEEHTDNKKESYSDSRKYRDNRTEEDGKRKPKEVEEDEDEEDEDNDSDLAKYDLFGDESGGEELILPRKNKNSKHDDEGQHQKENPSDRNSNAKDDRKRTHSTSRSFGGSSKRRSSSKELRGSRDRDRGNLVDGHRSHTFNSPSQHGSSSKYRKTHYKDNVEDRRRSRKDSYSSSSSSSSSSSTSSHLSRSPSNASSEGRHRNVKLA